MNGIFCDFGASYFGFNNLGLFSDTGLNFLAAVTKLIINTALLIQPPIIMLVKFYDL